MPIRAVPPKTISAVCPDCGGTRNCDVLFETERRNNEDIDEYFSISSWDCYMVLNCRGCDKLFFKHSHWFSEHTNDEGQPIIKEDYYPKKTLRERNIANTCGFPLIFLSNSLEKLIDETYSAINNDLPVIAAMSLRTLCDQILITTVGDKGGFAKNLDECVKKGHISESSKETIKAALEIGHAAVHRGYSPTMKEVLTALDIVENTAEQLLEHKHKAKTLSAKIPPRKKL